MDKQYWRDHDLTLRKQRIRDAFEGKPLKCGDDFPVLTGAPCYFAFGSKPRPVEYWTDPAVMLRFQQDGCEKHLSLVDDDYVPYFMPWFGTGVLASAFGCTVKPATGRGDDPAACGPCVSSVAEAARLRRPDLSRDGLVPTVSRFMEYAAAYGDLPVGMSDLNSPFSTAAQICGYDKLFIWMYDEPELVHELLHTVTDAFIEWVKLQKSIAGEPMDGSSGLQGIWTPKGGVWLSDDDLVSISPELYEEFLVPEYTRVFDTFGGGHLHWCGKGVHQLKCFKMIPSLTAINNSQLGDADSFEATVKGRPKGTVFEMQDTCTAEPEAYYDRLFSRIDDASGMLATVWLPRRLMMTDEGGYTACEYDIYAHADRVSRAIKSAAGRVAKEK